MLIYDDQPQMVEASHDFEWRDSGGAFRCVPSSVAEPLLAHAFAAIDCEALIEKIAPALWEVRRQRLPGKGEGMTPPWGDHYSGQTVEYYEMAEAALVAAGIIPKRTP